jgi:hypothetical protein
LLSAAENLEMNRQMISAIAKMLGVVRVIISLVYLAIQIRDQKKQSRNAVIRELSGKLRSVMSDSAS